MLARLASFGIALDAEAILRPAFDDRSRAIGRPWIARALIDGGHVASTNEAFDRWLSRGRPAFVPRLGAPPDEVFARVHDAGGIASLAHPGLLARDEWIPSFADAGLDALEAFHTDHDVLATTRYLTMADRLKLAVSGGSDYHADAVHGATGPGSVSLPQERFDALKARKK